MSDIKVKKSLEEKLTIFKVKLLIHTVILKNNRIQKSQKPPLHHIQTAPGTEKAKFCYNNV